MSTTKDTTLLIYVPKLTNRLGYTLNVLFRHVLQLPFEITDNKELFVAQQQPKLCYSSVRIGDALWIKPSTLLFSTTLQDVEIKMTQHHGVNVPFAVYGKELDFPFDVFAATFYLISRYEEYLPHKGDRYGRYPSADSMGVKENFLHLPVVEMWAHDVAAAITERYPLCPISFGKFEMEATVDIDAAYCYANKNILRSLGGMLRDALHRSTWPQVGARWRVLLGREQDPYDTFDYILHHLRIHPKIRHIFFALMGDYAMFDKPISYHNIDFHDLLQHLDDFAKMGIHTSYASYYKPEKVDMEIRRLSTCIHRDIEYNRCHFLKLAFPNTYRSLLRGGIRHDYTMGYADCIGFRAGISKPYPFFDINSDHETPLMIHPFAAMDTTLRRYLNYTPEEAIRVVQNLMDTVATHHGTFSYIVHNENLSEQFGWQGWRKVYEEVLAHGEDLLQNPV